jgi:AraC-like DNA-binding protein
MLAKSRMNDSAMPRTVSTKQIPRVLHLPPAGRPRWVCPKNLNLDLQYLSWGKRRFGESGVPISFHHGWVYCLVLQGNPILQFVSRAVRVQPGQILVLGPDCASGWAAATVESVAELLTWVWNGAPRCPGLGPTGDGVQTFTADRALIRTLQQIHSLCRRELEKPDALSALALEELRFRMDVAISRFKAPNPSAPEPALRLELALRWLAQNVRERIPVAPLCEYLQVSPVTLNRLFRTHLHESVTAYHTRIRMEWASQSLKRDGVAVKEVAYELGYLHANDFSRAFKKFTGCNPSQGERHVKLEKRVQKRTAGPSAKVRSRSDSSVQVGSGRT